MRYQLYLEEQRKLHAKSYKAKKRKAVEDELCKVKCKRKLLNKSIQAMSLKADKFFFYLSYLSSIYEKAIYRYVLDGKFALAWELPFPGYLFST